MNLSDVLLLLILLLLIGMIAYAVTDIARSKED